MVVYATLSLNWLAHRLLTICKKSFLVFSFCSFFLLAYITALTKKNATYNATLTLQQLRYSTYNKVLRLITLEVYNINIKKFFFLFFFVTLHHDTYRLADAQFTPLQV